MRKIYCLLLLLPIFLVALDYVPNEIIIQTNSPQQITRGTFGLPALDSYLANYQVKKITPVFPKNDNTFYVINLQNQPDISQFPNLRIAGVKTIQPNYLSSFYLEPNDQFFETQRVHYENINLPQAWNYTTGNEEILIAIVDSGVHFDHPDLQENIYYNENEIPDDGIDNDGNGYIDDYRGWDFVDASELSDIGIGDFEEQDNDPTDEINHGTHIAGIIGATTNNNLGVAGIVWNTKLLIIRSGFASSMGGYLQDDDAASGVIYAADMGAEIINLSWGDVSYSAIIDYAIQYAYERGSIVVCAAGNEGSNSEHPITYPARFANTISVGAVTANKQLASFSSYGPLLDLVAPGQQVFSTYDVEGENIYSEQSGTSMASPVVAAAVALLLSVEPGMNFEQVRTRLLTTTQDLGTIGFDNIYGNGLLDTYNLLTSTIVPQVLISYPADNASFNSSFDICGTVNVTPAEDFFRYSVAYTTEDMPGPTDWLPVNPTEDFYHYQQVEDDILDTFILEELMEDTTYKIKVEVVTSEQQHYSNIRTVHIDQTTPEFIVERSYITERFENEFNNYYIGASFDDIISLEVTDTANNATYYSNSADSLQIIQIPNTGNDESILDIRATNLAGLSTEISPAFSFENINKTIDTNSWEQNILDKQLIAIRNTYDFDNNGIEEIVAMEVQADSSRILKAFEFNGEILEQKNIFPFGSLFWPYDVGNLDYENTHLMGIQSASGKIYETDPESNYPNISVYTAPDCFGGSFVDVDDDGIDEFAFIRNLTFDRAFARVIVITEKNGNEFTDIDTLFNFSSSETMNAFTILDCAKLNNNNIPDIITADNDGDVMIFENGEPIWGVRLPVPNTKYLTTGDFTGDGQIDFCVGGYNYNASDPIKSFSYFAFFTFSNTTNTFVQIGALSFDNLEQRNSLISINIDEDEEDEIIILASPNIYIINYVDGEFVPTWNGETTKTFNNVLVAFPHTATHDARIISPYMEGEIEVSSIISPAAPFTGPATPTGFRATPIDSTSVYLNWDEHDYDEVKIYRKQNGDSEQIGNSTSTEFTDTNLTCNESYEYCIAGYDTDFIPPNSKSTLWKQVTPSPIPQLTNIIMSSPYELKIFFSGVLHNNSININHFFVNNDIGLPASVNFIEAKQGLLISFNAIFENLPDYHLTILGLQGLSEIPIPDENYAFTYAEDVTAPKIVSANSFAKDLVRIYFDETMEESQIENIENYNPVFPIIDSDNAIKSIVSGIDENGFYVEITLLEELKYSNQNYFIKIENVEDLSGNIISNDGNKCCFNLTDIVDLKHMIVYPNPLYLSEFNEIRFTNLPLDKNGSIRIYDLSGELVFSEKITPLTELKNYYGWNAENNKGKRVSSGMYLYFIKVGDDYKKGKLAVIH